MSRCGFSLGNGGSVSTMSFSQAHDMTARRWERTLLAVRPGLLPLREVASSWTQSRNPRISFLPRCSRGTSPPHRNHFLSVVAYSSRVRCAGLPELRYFFTADSSVVGRWSPTLPATVDLFGPYQPVAQCERPCLFKKSWCLPALG